MDRATRLEVLTEVVVEILGVDPAAVTEEARFRDDLGADSLDLVEIVMALEDRLGVSLPQDGLRGVETVGRALDLVESDLMVEAGAEQGRADAAIACVEPSALA